MKQLLLSFLFLLIIGSASAQTSKGEYYIGGSLSYNYNSLGTTNTYNFDSGYTIYTTSKISAFSLSPEFGYFLSNKWSISVQPVYSNTSGTETSNFYSYTSSTGNYVSSDNYHNGTLGIGINLRYYCMITDKFGFFPQFGVSTLNNSIYLKYGTFSIGGTPNFVFFATPKLGVNLGFGGINYNLDYQTKAHTLNAALNNNISFGLDYYWGKK